MIRDLIADSPVCAAFVNDSSKPENCFFAKRVLITDSLEEAEEMEYCFVSREAVLGKALFRYFPSITWLASNPYDKAEEE